MTSVASPLMPASVARASTDHADPRSAQRLFDHHNYYLTNNIMSARTDHADPGGRDHTVASPRTRAGNQARHASRRRGGGAGRQTQRTQRGDTAAQDHEKIPCILSACGRPSARRGLAEEGGGPRRSRRTPRRYSHSAHAEEIQSCTARREYIVTPSFRRRRGREWVWVRKRDPK